jgi:cyclin-dependent kinase 12/13
VQLAASTGFAWAKKPRPDATTAAAAVTKRSGSKGPGTNNNSNGGGDGARTTSAAAAGAAAAAAAPYEVEKQEMIKQWAQVADAFSASEAYNSRFRQTLDAKQLKTGKVSLSQLTTHKHCRLAVQCCLLHSFWIL